MMTTAAGVPLKQDALVAALFAPGNTTLPESLRHKLRERAYWLWVEAGRPHGRDLEVWFLARADLRIPTWLS